MSPIPLETWAALADVLRGPYRPLIDFFLRCSVYLIIGGALTLTMSPVSLETRVALADVLRGQVHTAGVPVTVMAQRTEIRP